MALVLVYLDGTGGRDADAAGGGGGGGGGAAAAAVVAAESVV